MGPVVFSTMALYKIEKKNNNLRDYFQGKQTNKKNFVCAKNRKCCKYSKYAKEFSHSTLPAINAENNAQ